MPISVQVCLYVTEIGRLNSENNLLDQISTFWMCQYGFTAKETTMDELQKTRLLRLKEVLQFYPVGKSTWWAGVKKGRFPQPVKIGTRSVAWRAEDINLLIENPEHFLNSNEEA